MGFIGCKGIFLLDAYGKSLLQFSLKRNKTDVKPLHLPQFYFVGTSKIHQKDEGIYRIFLVYNVALIRNITLRM